MKKDKSSQTQRIYNRLLAAGPGVEVNSVALHRAGSGSAEGWVNSLSRRISDIRNRLLPLGQTVICSSNKVDVETGQMMTKYKIVPLDDREEILAGREREKRED